MCFRGQAPCLFDGPGSSNDDLKSSFYVYKFATNLKLVSFGCQQWSGNISASREAVDVAPGCALVAL